MNIIAYLAVIFPRGLDDEYVSAYPLVFETG